MTPIGLYRLIIQSDWTPYSTTYTTTPAPQKKFKRKPYRISNASSCYNVHAMLLTTLQMYKCITLYYIDISLCGKQY